MEAIQSKEQWVLHRLEGFYTNPDHFQRIQDVLSGSSRISLRLLDWFVTNYSKKHNVSYLTKSNRHVIVYLVYKSHLKAYNKKMFDPFCRWKRIQFRGLDTTVGQLNFFEWAIQDEVLEYLETHYDEIHTDMESNSQVLQPKDGERRKRHELSRSATKSVRIHDVPVKVTFD
jgi:ubiquitin C-terminal hydrolase